MNRFNAVSDDLDELWLEREATVQLNATTGNKYSKGMLVNHLTSRILGVCAYLQM